MRWLELFSPVILGAVVVAEIALINWEVGGFGEVGWFLCIFPGMALAGMLVAHER